MEGRPGYDSLRAARRGCPEPHRLDGQDDGHQRAHVWEIGAADGGARVRTEESWDGFIVRLLGGMMRKQLQKAMDGGLAHLEAELKRRAGQ